MPDSNLTIIMPLKDRAHYTLRILKYLDATGCPFKILVADGGHEDFERLLSRGIHTANLDMEYIRYPYDHNLGHYHEKMRDVISRVETPLALLYDNDDFYITEGIYSDMQYLADNPEYASARGTIFDCSVSKGVFGKVENIRDQYTKYPDSVIGDTVAARVLDQANRFHANYHNVRKTKNLAMTFELIRIADPVNFRIAHQMEGFLCVVWGNSHRGNHDFMLHQSNSGNTPTQEGWGWHFPNQQDWINAAYWIDDFTKMIDIFGCVMHRYDGIPLEEARQLFGQFYLGKLPAVASLLASRIAVCMEKEMDADRINKLLNSLAEHNIDEPLQLDVIKREKASADEKSKIIHYLENDGKIVG